MAYYINLDIIRWMRTFLKNQEVIIESSDYVSPAFKIDIAVLQGSELSPLLFVIFLNNFYVMNFVTTNSPTKMSFWIKAVMKVTTLKNLTSDRKMSQQMENVSEWLQDRFIRIERIN